MRRRRSETEVDLVALAKIRKVRGRETHVNNGTYLRKSERRSRDNRASCDDIQVKTGRFQAANGRAPFVTKHRTWLVTRRGARSWLVRVVPPDSLSDGSRVPRSLVAMRAILVRRVRTCVYLARTSPRSTELRSAAMFLVVAIRDGFRRLGRPRLSSAALGCLRPRSAIFGRARSSSAALGRLRPRSAPLGPPRPRPALERARSSRWRKMT